MPYLIGLFFEFFLLDYVLEFFDLVLNRNDLVFEGFSFDFSDFLVEIINFQFVLLI